MNAALAAKFDAMRRRLAELESVAVAFSAGVDSTFVLKVAQDVLGRDRVLAVTGRSASVPRAELAEAREIAESLGAEHVFLDIDEFADPRYTANPTNRCYYCKTTLYAHLGELLRTRRITWVVNGTNADDLGDWRPGLVAATEHRVIAPLAEAGLTKQEVRELSATLGLPTFDKPASPCLSSRIPYGQEVTPEKLRAVEAGERFLKETFAIRECRVRHFGAFARIEVPPALLGEIERAENSAGIAAHFRTLGFERVEIDPRGFRSGSLNEVIAFGQRQGAAAS